MKKKYKLKKQKAQNGIQQVQTYEDSPIQATELRGASGVEQGGDRAVETVAGNIPIAAAFMTVGKAGYGAMRQEDKFKVAKSDAMAGLSTTWAPHKQTLRSIKEGDMGRTVTSLILPWKAARDQNRDDRAKRDELIKQQEAANRTKAFAGEDITMSQTDQIYKQGTAGATNSKVVEAEKDELIFRKVGTKYKLIKDLKGKPSHAKGGSDVVVTEGDVITPGKDRKSIMSNVDSKGFIKDTGKFNSYRLKLPKDKPVANEGSEYLKPKGLGGITGLKTIPINPQVTANPNAPIDNYNQTNSFGGKMGGYLNTAAQLAPAMYNIGQGLFGKVEREQGNFVTPDLFRYQDSSDPLRRASNSAYMIDAANARNLSGGNAGNVRANLNQANVANFNRKQDINNAEVDRALQVSNMNTDLKNRYKLLNAQEKARVNEINSANRARKADYLGAGLNSLSSYAQARKDDKEMENLNEVLASTLEKRNYKYDSKAKKYKLKK